MIHVVELIENEMRNTKVMNMKVTNLTEETNEDNIFILVIGGRAKAYVIRVEKHMFRGVNGPGH